MSRIKWLSPLARIFSAAAALTIVFAAGLGTGAYLLPGVIADHQDHDSEPHDHGGSDQHSADEHAHGEEEPILALTEQAVHNLGLELGLVQRGDYWKTILVPASVVEIPGRSDLSVSAPVTGVVTSVHVVPGQSLVAGQPLFDMRLTDESLTDAQSKLLGVLARRDVAQQEVDRLAPLVDSGAVAASKKRELQYDLKRLDAEQATLVQELRGRGMPESSIDSILQNRSLATALKVFPPDFVSSELAESVDGSSGYSVETVHVHPGKTVARGTDLCSIAYHQKLYIEGTAFEEDLPVLNRIMENGWQITAEQHQTHGDHTHRTAGESLQLLRVDNHVDEDTQTVRFFVELSNEVARQREEEGRTFELWKFRPGQRLHLRLPVDHWEDQWVLPAGAVVVEGPNVLVFAKHEHEREHKYEYEHNEYEDQQDKFPNNHGDKQQNKDAHSHENEPYLELEPVPVRLLHRDDRTVVIAGDGQLHADDQVALNQAYKLHLALKMQMAGGGGGHHHGHEH